MVVDDEPLARRRLTRLLAGMRGVEVAGEAGDGPTALARIQHTAPSVVLLDVQMPEMDGLAVSRRLRPPRPLIVFVTAFDRFAVEAFDVQAIDYLLKPVSETRLAAALDRVRERLSLAGPATPPRRPIERLPVRSQGRVDLIPVADIDWLEAADNYVVVHAGRRTHILRDTLSRLEAELDPTAFARIHRATIVRIDRIIRLDVATRGDYRVTLADGTDVTMSRTFKEKLEQAIGRRF
jgi:two-component system LytT family response regulator